MAVSRRQAGVSAVEQKGWLAASKWLALRRLSQLAILGVFLIGPWFGFWVVKGNLASSLTLDVVPLTDPLLVLQQVAAGHSPAPAVLLGALIVLALYLIVGGRAYCSWVCPINIVTDAAAWLRSRLGIRGGAHFSRRAWYWMLAGILMLAALTGSIAWELVNPVTMVFRGLIFGMGFAWGVVAAIFVLDLVIGRRAWCGHLCPVGAFYGLIGWASLLRVSAAGRERCDDCMDCFLVCPEQQVIRPALKGDGQGRGPVILSGHCTNCGRCIDVCTQDVFRFSTRFHNDPRPQRVGENREVMP